MPSRGTLYIAQTGNVLYCVDILGRAGRMDQTIRCCFFVPHEREGIGSCSLHFSPRGEAKWVRGPSGLGASRVEEKGARNTAFDQARGASQRKFRGFHETRDTRHESRLLCFSRITSHETRITAFD